MRSSSWKGAVGLGILVMMGCADRGATDAEWLITAEYAGRADGSVMSPTEIVEMVRPESPLVSPDGHRVAFLTRRARVDSNDHRVRLHVAPASGSGAPRTLLEARSISNVRWSPDGEALFYRVGRPDGSRVERMPLEEGEPTAVLDRAPSAFELGPAGRRIAYVTGVETVGSDQEYDGSGVVWDEEEHDSRNAMWGEWGTAEQNQVVWIRDLPSGDARKVWQNPDGIVAQIAWSPTGRELAISYEAPPHPEEGGVSRHSDMGVLSLSDLDFRVVGDSYDVDWAPAFSPDGSELAFITPPRTITRVDLESGGTTEIEGPEWVGSANALWWVDDAARLLVQREGRVGSGIHTFDLTDQGGRWLTPSEDYFGPCSVARGGDVTACVRQNPVTPPEVVTGSLADGRFEGVTDLNPEIAGMRLGTVRKLRWANEYADTANGWLVLPPDYRDGRRYPLLMVLYGFNGKFVSQAEWLSSMPAQTLAADGFVVFLINPAGGSGQSVVDDYREARRREAWSPLSSIRIAVDRLASQGMIDRERIGMMGWSYGGFLTQMAVTHTDLLAAASAGEAGLWDPGLYWATGSRRFQRVAENIHGAPPYGNLDRWAEFSPALNAHRAEAPVLAQSADRDIAMLEFFTAMRRQGKQMELVYYPDEGHVFGQPRHRVSSMRINRDWFNFWLRGEERAGAEEQYERWRAMREALADPEP